MKNPATPVERRAGQKIGQPKPITINRPITSTPRRRPQVTRQAYLPRPGAVPDRDCWQQLGVVVARLLGNMEPVP